MLDTCFTHLPGVGPVFEAKLRAHGIRTWTEALDRPLPCGAAKATAIRRGLEESLARLARAGGGDAAWFSRALPPARQWRLYPHFRHSAAFVDIETTGLSWPEDAITSIALFDGETVRTYVRGYNLEAFADDILDYKLLVTWNGRCFDAPILRRHLRIPLDQGDMGHLDLLPVFRALDLRGGLKKVEKRLGLDREGLDGVDGWAAVLLWREFEQTGNHAALETLLAYNVEDVLSLEVLAGYAVDRYAREAEDAGSAGADAGIGPLTAGIAGTGAGADGRIDAPPVGRVKRHLNPHRADTGLLRRLLGWRGMIADEE